MDKLMSLIIALVTTFVITTPFAFEAYFTTTIFVAILTMITSYYASKYVISA
ncbi:hypothetical protein G8Y85_01470 [Staphylococcus sp. 11007852]|uniref:hypothetical protein n=1 Tax=Staphylococcus TaxID=1279 RepID=UPI001403A0AA|nr:MULTISPECIES: hypothetical protein [Staphylococcus]MCO4357965.1 hypothetical protein [Staphylococcus agnetis]MCO4363317.1 hypothetical protein [Staphylococcus agnetis]NHM74103.1 hypothetical protein [Staphylococcus sp. 11007852]